MNYDPDPKSKSERCSYSEHCRRLELAADICELYAEKEYLDAYTEHTDLRVADDPHAAVGGMWNHIGALQFEFLKEAGLEPHHSLLDIGCGTLRGGRHFIQYLHANRYTRIDISAKAIDYACALVHEEGLVEKHPLLVLCKDKGLKFSEIKQHTFDFILAHSVFTHLMPHHIEECFRHIGMFMTDRTQFFFTFSPAAEIVSDDFKNFSYPQRFFHELAQRYSFVINEPRYAFDHPRQQRMLVLTRPHHSGRQ